MQEPTAYYSKTIRQGGDTAKQYGSDPSTSEELFRDGAMYLTGSSKSPGWISWPATITGISAEYIRKTATGKEEDFGPDLLDYSGTIAKATDVQFVDIEDIDGHETAHYTFHLGLNDFYLILEPKCTNCNEENARANGMTGYSITADVWIGTSDYLPYKFITNAQFDSPKSHVNATATATFANYSQPVEIPGVPPDAVPCSSFADPHVCFFA
jgi:hypothetical protein